MIHNLLDKYLLHEVPRDPVTLLGLSAATVVPAAAGSAEAGGSLIPLIGSMATTAAGGTIGAIGAETQGRLSKQIADYKATQDTINASQSVASAGRRAFDTEEKTRLAISTLRAKGGASGVDLTSPSAIALAGGIASRGAYHAGMDLWQGENQAAGYLTEAQAEEASGQAAEIGTGYSAAGTIAGMGSSMFLEYGRVRYPNIYGSMSDVRAKELIAPVGRVSDGINLYRFRYIDEPTEYVGVIAQEVASATPEAVAVGPDGYLYVDYDAVGARMLTWGEWLEIGRAPESPNDG